MMTGMSAGEPHGLWPADLNERAAEVLEFIAGHVIVQDQLDDGEERKLEQWIALLGRDIGGACAAIAERPGEPDGVRAAVAWLACASADTLRARLAFAPGDRVEQLERIEAHVVSARMLGPA